MTQRFVKPVAPYSAPAGLTSGDVPFAAVPFDPDAPNTEIVKKGTQFVHTATKSTTNGAVAYLVQDACSNEYYVKANASSNINQTVDCQIVSIFSGSLSLTVPRDIDAAAIAEFVDTLVSMISTAVSEANV